MLKQREAAFKLLQNDQASQIEAFKEEWRKEHIIRLKWENDYKELLQTWQAFEQDQPVIIGAESAESNQVGTYLIVRRFRNGNIFFFYL